MTKDKNELAENLHERLREGRAAAQERRRERRDGELDRLAKMRDEAKGPLRDWLTARLERRREELERATKRRADRKAKRAARDARRQGRRGAAGGSPKAPGGAPAMNARDTIAAVALMPEDELGAARAAEEARDKPRTTVLEAMDARELELAGE